MPLVAEARLSTRPLTWDKCAKVISTKTDISQQNASLLAKLFLE